MTFIEKRKFYTAVFVVTFLVLVGLIIFSSTLGVARISFFESIRIMLDKVPLINRLVSTEGIEKTHHIIVLKIRMPRILLAALVGMGLSVVGSTFQGMFKNPMADPYVLGISSGAAFGATIAMILGLGHRMLGMGLTTVLAFTGAIFTTLIVFHIGRIGNKLPTVTLLLAGIAVNFFLSSMISMMMIFNREQIEKIVFWLMGSVSAASWKQVGILFPIVTTGVIAIAIFARDLNVMATGDETARSLGIEVEKVKKVLLVISSIVVGACVSVSGIIGFVGLMIPHAVRLLLGADHRAVIPFSALGGAIFLVLSDTLARNLIPPGELPVGAITSAFGAPYFIYLLIQNKKKVN